jgi:hypothetical protein
MKKINKIILLIGIVLSLFLVIYNDVLLNIIMTGVVVYIALRIIEIIWSDNGNN